MAIQAGLGLPDIFEVRSKAVGEVVGHSLADLLAGSVEGVGEAGVGREGFGEASHAVIRRE